MRILTVGDMKQVIKGLPDDMIIRVEYFDDKGEHVVRDCVRICSTDKLWIAADKQCTPVSKIDEHGYVKP